MDITPVMETTDKDIFLGELILIKEEDVQIKEEDLEIQHEPAFFNEMEEVYSQGEKRSPSPSSHEMVPGSKQNCPGLEESRDSSTGSGHNNSISESPTAGQRVKKAKNLLPNQAKQVVMNIHNYFRSRNHVISETDLQIKVAAATGISVSSVQRIKKQAKDGKIHSPPPVRIRQAPVINSVDDFGEGFLRREILSFYERREIPTLNTLLDIVKEPPISFQGGRSTLNKLIKKIGFRYMKVAGGRQILMEKEDVVASRCKFLRTLDNNRNSISPRSEVFIDETWICQKECVQTNVRKLKNGKEVQYIIVHAGGEKGFVPGGLLMFRPQSNNMGHFKDLLTPQCFQTWFKDQLLPNIPKNSLIVMDNAPCHSKLVNGVPNRSMKKCDIIQWLEENNVAHDSTVSKSELLHLVNSDKEKLKYEIDLIAHDFGHEVLRLPPHHNHLNPLELIWHQVKSKIKSKSSQDDQTLQTVEELIKDALASVTEKDWRMYMCRTREIEEDYKNKDKAVDCMLETLPISLDESSTDEED